ncbi:MAG: hypothetical protein BKP49_07960 [Treponema sp. CETP13]|nr:MAG: hypothetical protein BKP49_07960 [Treponema sp. CETP13]
MSDEKKEKSSRPVLFEAGELEKTRRNLGPIDEEEAKRIASLLGGKIGIEKPEPVDTAAIKRIASDYRTSKRSAHNKKNSLKDKKRTTNNNAYVQNITNNTKKAPIRPKIYELPIWDSKNLAQLSKVMESEEYKIQQNQNILKKIFQFAIGYNDKILPDYIEITLKENIRHIQSFIHSIKYIFALATPLLKKQISEKQDWPEKVLNFILNWNIQSIKIQYLQLESTENSITIKKMVPIIRKFYRELMPLYFINEAQMTKLIKKMYLEVSSHIPKKKEQLLKYAKNATSEWVYINNQLVKSMFPLLLRMASKEMHIYPDYFTTNISEILRFLGLTKFDIILPQKDKSIEEENEKKLKQAAEQKALLQMQEEKKEQKLVLQSLEVLERLFPEAGWQSLNTKPDLFPYFQPLYNFQDGFNLISEKNPLQITIILLRIIEDLFQACRLINFTVQGDLDFVIANDSMQNIFATWSLYRDDILGKQILPDLIESVNQLHTKPDFFSSSYGKRTLSNWLWIEKHYFLPKISFDLIFMARPTPDSTYLPLPARVTYLKNTFTKIIQRAEKTAKENPNPYDSGINLGASNLWDNYEFEIQNTISHRLEILLGGKNSSLKTNLNLLKYTLCVINVLDWWINSDFSPAYKEKITSIYRTDEAGHPIYTVPLLSNQNKIFMQHIKSNLQGNYVKKNTSENSEVQNT